MSIKNAIILTKFLERCCHCGKKLKLGSAIDEGIHYKIGRKVYVGSFRLCRKCLRKYYDMQDKFVKYGRPK